MSTVPHADQMENQQTIMAVTVRARRVSHEHSKEDLNRLRFVSDCFFNVMSTTQG